MHQTAKGKQWYQADPHDLGLAGERVRCGCAALSAAWTRDASVGDQGYQGQTEVIRARAPRAKDFTNRKYRGRGSVYGGEKAKNRTKAQVRAKVEHTIGVKASVRRPVSPLPRSCQEPAPP
jgi:IS5 family transposase